jgi:Rps23 Pro-64 3,4-dihydroxylase Tpa1-like proline 4-hydroxylase
MWRLDDSWSDEAALAERWRTANPFPHLVFDDVLAPEALAELMAILEEEVIEHYENDIYSFDASSPTAISDSLRRVRDDFGSTFGPALARITGKAVNRADMRAFAYRPGHFLLPHSDHQMGVGRQLAYAYYAPSPDPPEDGALELFRCDVEGGEILRAESARIIEPCANRMAIFDVSDVSLHQVREVLAGLRVSLAGWFYE